MSRALIVDDDLGFRTSVSHLVEREGFEVATAADLAEARGLLAKDPPDVVIADLMLPDGRGIELVQALPDGARTEFIVITGHASVESVIEAMRAGVLDYLTKPVDMPRLKAVLANLARTTELKTEIGVLRTQLRELGRFGSLVGSSRTMQKVYDLIARVAPTDASVLLIGESGTGKEIVAQTIHEISRRRRGPFVPVNCGAIPEGLIESELFGHEKGSFTGASQQRRGQFELASEGTLLLDEITEMPVDLQVKLLRVLETGSATRVGGEEALAVNARVIAATNRRPELAVRDGKFREDLFYRLNVFPIALPPLRDRDGDAELLADRFLEELNQTNGTARRFRRGTDERLRSYSWPGNVRELKNMIHRAFIMAEEEVVLEIPGEPAFRRTNGQVAPLTPGISLDEAERRLIFATLESHGGDKRKTAEVLGIALKTLYNRLKRYEGRTGARNVSEDNGAATAPAVEEEPAAEQTQ